jgi:hypothetical protein
MMVIIHRLKIVNNIDDHIRIPENRKTLLKELYNQLNLLSSGRGNDTPMMMGNVGELGKSQRTVVKDHADSFRPSILLAKQSETEANHDNDIVFIESDPKLS